jgi:TorA maturation chaperone TorD
LAADVSGIAKLLAEACIYNLLGKIFDGDIEAIYDSAQQQEFERSIDALQCRGLKQSFAALQKQLPLYSQDDLKLEYTRLFTKGEGHPYESSHLPNPYGKSHELADVAGFYSAYGVKAGKDLPDHIASELEFMGLLSFKEGYALAHNLSSEAEICREAQKKFLQQHLLPFLKRFTEHIKTCSKIPLYQILADFTYNFVKCHAIELGLDNCET